ncbi:ABC transporter permease subunit [Wenzhouxiangella sp. XN201]|uniref:ABC transporter permease subunit n=1 Tax=Wenzhouxiangella sp. XN201 TaxID=2710755 RepID=UPI0013C7B754|nr:ABC transporter permease subunit [Wenzhouxiangella sp. XN201]NEZ05064.1 ABC transporter permease subunit [Wenzhouxiangella sp. XN201]
MARRRRRRYLADGAARWMVRAGGGGVVVALALIFVYLFSEVFPLLRGATVDPGRHYVTADSDATDPARLALERYGEIGMRYSRSGELVYFRLGDGEVIRRIELPIPEGVSVTSVGNGEPRAKRVAFGLSDGTAIILEHGFELEFPEAGVRNVVPDPEFPVGREPVVVDEQGQALNAIAVQKSRDDTGVAAQTADGRMLFVRYRVRTGFLTGETEINREDHTLPATPGAAIHLQLSANLWNLLAADAAGNLVYWDIARPDEAVVRDRRQVVDGPAESITSLQYLNGTFSAVVGTSSGKLSQWFLVRDETEDAGDNIFYLARARDFEQHPGAITAIQPEYSRKGFVAVDDAGFLGIHYGTSARTLYLDRVSDEPLVGVAVSPVNERILVEDSTGRIQELDLWNEHPESSFRALWSKVWYEGRSDPEYVWQASSGSDSFEPKYSMVPLTVGTLKAAFFAMLFAMPLAIAGAIYTAYFMSPKLRGYVKPTIEVMEALPTVILGFLAGLWLAPFLENHIPVVFTVLVGLPLAFILVALAWAQLPRELRNRLPGGWEAVILMPVVCLLVWGMVALSPLIEIWFFDGSMRQWFTDMGITYDQRNALVVGIAMGFAVIPTIFSIAEDAVFTVPKHLTQGSLALGATPWQTVTRVILLTASPGIFSAVMIGFGRAVGETMIVLMATGNSPVVNFNIFEGMRTLSANIAVELPETAVNSTHFRILFLAGLVLFAMTFTVNTIAEIVRQRLRARYSNL